MLMEWEPFSISDLNGAGTDNCGAPTGSLSKTQFDCDDVSVESTPVATDLFFSEYVEGSGGGNKYLEIFNGTGASVDLSDYEVSIYRNGSPSTSSSNTYVLSGMLADGGVLVLANGGASIYSGAVVSIGNSSSGPLSFNGDDALALIKKSTGDLVDVIGEIGVDPGSRWSVNGISTQKSDSTP